MNARRTTVAAVAGLVALAGAEHGLGEILQGPVPPPALSFPSWVGVPFFEPLAGEPAMSVVPSLLVSGILSIVVSLTFLAVATLFVDRRGAALGLLTLSVLLLLVGGGFGPPFLGVIVALAALKVRSPLRWWRRVHGRTTEALAAAWPWALAACLLAWLALFPGIPLAGTITRVRAETVVPEVFALALVSLLASISFGLAHDAARMDARQTFDKEAS
jgi:hypothetical protein